MFIKKGDPQRVMTTDLSTIKHTMCSACKLDKSLCKNCGVKILQHVTVSTEASENAFVDYGDALEEACRNDN